MNTTKCTRAPGRPRNFDPEMAVAKVQPLFHAHGYDAVSVADVTAALSIKPPVSMLLLGTKSVFMNACLVAMYKPMRFRLMIFCAPTNPFLHVLPICLKRRRDVMPQIRIRRDVWSWRARTVTIRRRGRSRGISTRLPNIKFTTLSHSGILKRLTA